MATLFTKESINQFIAANNPRALTQTGHWLDIEKANGHQAYIIFSAKKKDITGSVLLIKHQLPMGQNYLYAPYGPVIKKELSPEKIPPVIDELINEIHRYIDLKSTIFIRFEPFYQDCHVIFHTLRQKGFTPTNQFTQPKDTLILNLLQGENALFKNFKQKTRYNIRLADKKNIIVEKTANPEKTKYFYELLIKTCDRDKFKPHPYSHYENIINILGPKDIAYIYLAHYGQKIIAANIVTFFGGVATYLHGASSNTYRNLMPTYALQWQAIKDAINLNYRYYDFGGIAPTGAPANHAWQGITKFKEGFNGITVSSMGHMEKTVKHFWHYAYKAAKFMQK